MLKAKNIILFTAIPLGALCLAFMGLVIWEIFTQPEIVTVNDPHVITISQGTQAYYWGLHVGVASVRTEKYLDDAGIERQGDVAFLKFHYPADTSTDVGIEAYPGKNFKVAGYDIKVEEVNKVWIGGSVRLDIRSPRDKWLADPALLYVSESSYGLCGNDKGQTGGCSSKMYLFSSGRLIDSSTWDAGGDDVNITTTVKELGKAMADKVAKLIKASGVLTADCRGIMVEDASWSYTVNINGVKKEFENPPAVCKAIFDKIDKLLEKK